MQIKIVHQVKDTNGVLACMLYVSAVVAITAADIDYVSQKLINLC